MMPIRLTRSIKVLLIIYFAVFVLHHTIEQFFGGNISGIFALVPARFVSDLWIWQIFTYAFLHADVMHLFLNMLMLAFIGADLEAIWKPKAFLRYYFFCSIFAGFCYLVMQLFITGGLYSPMVGASGGIYGILIAYGLIYGERTMLFLLLFPMKAKHFIWILAAVEFMTMVFSPTGNKFSAVAHLGGMLGGFMFLWIQAAARVRARNNPGKPSLTQKLQQFQSKRKRKHLKLVVDRDESTKEFSKFDPDNDEEGGGGPKTWH